MKQINGYSLLLRRRTIKIYSALFLWKTWLRLPFPKFASLAEGSWVTAVPFGAVFLILCPVPSMPLHPMPFINFPGSPCHFHLSLLLREICKAGCSIVVEVLQGDTRVSPLKVRPWPVFVHRHFTTQSTARFAQSAGCPVASAPLPLTSLDVSPSTLNTRQREHVS